MIYQYLLLVRITCSLTLFLPALTTINSLIYLGQTEISSNSLTILAAFLIIGLVGNIALHKTFPSFQHYFISNAVLQKTYLENHSSKSPALFICLSAALSLLLELAIIRWHSSLFPVISFYKNFSLLGCLAGLGTGYALSKSKHLPLPIAPILLCTQVILLTLLAGAGNQDTLAVLRVEPITSRLSMGLFSTLNPFPLIAFYLFLLINFALSTLIFLPLGQVCGLALDQMDSLRAYSWNLTGSLLGIGGMFIMSSFWLPPIIWFIIAFFMLLPLIGATRGSITIAATMCLISCLLLSWYDSKDLLKISSPYQQLEMKSIGNGEFELMAAGHYHQRLLNLGTTHKQPDENKKIAAISNYYDLPFKIAPGSKHVGIVGAGTGNDVATAIRNNVEFIDAIEIDPAILYLGKIFHPESPYQHSGVSPIISDARHHLKTHPNSYDLLIFGLLDSHTLLSNVNNIRLESYVYTTQALREARASLKEDGVLTLAFAVLDESLGKKIFLMLQEAFDGTPPICFITEYDRAVVFVSSKNNRHQIPTKILENSGIEDISNYYATSSRVVDLSTDDWPFFYMPKKAYPISYLPLAMIVLIVCIGVWKMCGIGSPNRQQIAFFCLGAGFMLVETKAIAELALCFGNTWQVVALTISAILVMAFLANIYVSTFGKKSVNMCLIFVVASLLLAYFSKGIIIEKAGESTPLVLTIILTLPIFFAGLSFSSILSEEKQFSKLMGANLIGAMVGGLLEYNAMYFGYNSLNLLAALFYGITFILLIKYKRGGI